MRLPSAEEHPPGPAALYEPPPAPPAPPVLPVPPAPSTGWTLTGLPAAAPAAPAAQALPLAQTPGAGGLGAAPRGRILVVEGGYGGSGRRSWGGRGGAGHAPVLSAMLAAVSPQVLLAADAVDAVHLPGAVDPQTVLAHLRAAALHPGPLLVHLGGHVIADKRGGQLQLTLRDARQDGLPWQAIAAELSHRPAEWQTLVIADLSADQNAWPYLQGTVSPLSEGIPLWAVVSPDPEQIGTFTRALIEALHGGRPGAGDVLAPEQLRQQVYSVLRPDVVILATHAKDRPVFRNTARRGDGPPADAVPAPVPAAAAPPVAPLLPRQPEPQDAVAGLPVAVPSFVPAPAAAEPEAAAATVADADAGQVSLVKPGVPPTPRRRTGPVSLLKAGQAAEVEEAAGVSLRKAVPAEAAPESEPATAAPSAGVTLAKPRPQAELPQVELPQDEPELAPAVEGPQDTVPADGVPADAVPSDAVPSDAPPEDEPPLETAPSDATEAPTAEPVTEAPAEEPPAEEPPAEEPPASQPRADYREVIGRIVRSADAGDHAAATDLAFALELEAIAEHGAVSEPVLQVRQVRAHVCRLAGRLSEAAVIYREVALTMLRSRGADSPEAQQAATNAEACWRTITDRTEAVRIAPEIIELRAHLPGPDGRKLRAAERHLAHLVAAPATDQA
ncbi:hypothetical protein [Streptomyces sp. Y1]|uniref:Tetratricopeptide repeat protein n=1 Tax=Streptomyces sp. Y1 TaxID=3238634 RepID=A0AB39TBI8_9ACTN